MPAATDITGQRFGRLTAVRRSAETAQKWVFKCDCGKLFAARKTNVRMGKTSSCGCVKAELNRARNYVDLTGRTFGDLVVNGPAGYVKNGGNSRGSRPSFNCTCACGRNHVVIGKTLINGNTTSCGSCNSLRNRDLTGMTFGRLTVACVNNANPGAGSHRTWDAVCSCGNTVSGIPTGSLSSGNTQSCGCLISETAVRNFKNDGHRAFAADPDHADRLSWVYLVEIDGVVDKIGIAFDMYQRGRTSAYTNTWWKRQLTRAQCWAVEQCALHLTREFRPSVAAGNSNSGPSEQRTGWVLNDVITMIDELCDECVSMGWHEFYDKYLLA